jgi:hypothetical protein
VNKLIDISFQATGMSGRLSVARRASSEKYLQKIIIRKPTLLKRQPEKNLNHVE